MKTDFEKMQEILTILGVEFVVFEHILCQDKVIHIINRPLDSNLDKSLIDSSAYQFVGKTGRISASGLDITHVYNNETWKCVK